VLSLVNNLDAEVMTAGSPYAFEEAAPILSMISNILFYISGIAL